MPEPISPVKKLMNPVEASEYLGVHIVTIYRLLKGKKIPAFKVGSQWRFKQDELDQFFATMK